MNEVIRTREGRCYITDVQEALGPERWELFRTWRGEWRTDWGVGPRVEEVERFLEGPCGMRGRSVSAAKSIREAWESEQGDD